MASTLTPLQVRVLEEFFAREQRFYLTGGAALAGFHLGHRSTHDLDLFTSEDVLEDGERALRAAAAALGAQVIEVQSSCGSRTTARSRSVPRTSVRRLRA